MIIQQNAKFSANCILSISTQPAKHFRCRYKSELTASTHGVLLARNAVLRSEFPVIKLKHVTNIVTPELYLICMVYVRTQTADNGFALSSFQLCRRTRKRYANSEQRIECGARERAKFEMEPLVSRMESVRGEFEYVLRDVCIVKSVKGDAAGILQEKQKWLQKNCPKLKINMAAPHRRHDEYYLGFTACIKTNDIYEPITETVFSEPIMDGPPPEIRDLLPRLVQGGHSVIYMVTSGIRMSEVKARLYHCDNQRNVIWEMDLVPKQSESRHIMKFEAPPYDGEIDENATEVKCWLQICNKYVGEWSSPVAVSYVNDRKLQSENCIDLGIGDKSPKGIDKFMKIINAKTEESDIWHHIEQFNEVFRAQDALGNTIFHALIASDNFNIVTKLSNFSKMTALFPAALNNNGENLLHFACKMNKSHFIPLLVGFGKMLYMRDHKQRTALYIAMEEQQLECITEFCELFRSASSDTDTDTDTALIAELKNLIFARILGRTILHWAIAHKLSELLEAMLQFCLKHNVNVCGLRTDFKHETLLHVAVNERNVEMAKLILQYVPSMWHCRDSSGQRIEDMKPASIYRSVINHLMAYGSKLEEMDERVVNETSRSL